MPRTLPWLTGTGKTKRESNSPAAAIKRTASPRVKHETPTRKETCTFLREGLDKDDIYMMVEDEFYTVAQTFTQHLHYAEYIRRKKEAKLQNAATVADIARPTDGVTPMSAELKKKYAADELRMRQGEGLDAALGKREQDDDVADEVEEENSWAGTHLQDLMLSPRRVKSLVGLQGVRSLTRAAAGFSQSSGLEGDGEARDQAGNGGPSVGGRKELAPPGDTTDDDDDLDAGVGLSTPTITRGNRGSSNSGSLRNSSSARRPSPNSIHSTSKKDIEAGTSQSPTITKKYKLYPNLEWLRRPASSKRNPSEKRTSGDKKEELPVTETKDTHSNPTQAKRRLIFDDFDELPELHKSSIPSEKRRPHFTNSKQKKFNDDRDKGSKKSRLNEVPMFLL
ncbi:hypothetical protein BJX76DRAFT_350831 [Aspergillus varians]